MPYSQAMEVTMDDQAERTAPQALIQSLDASLRDLETGAVFDAAGVQAEVRELLAEYERAHAATRPSVASKQAGKA
jgi:hypothetical protein